MGLKRKCEQQKQIVGRMEKGKHDFECRPGSDGNKANGVTGIKRFTEVQGKQ